MPPSKQLQRQELRANRQENPCFLADERGTPDTRKPYSFSGGDDSRMTYEGLKLEGNALGEPIAS